MSEADIRPKLVEEGRTIVIIETFNGELIPTTIHGEDITVMERAMANAVKHLTVTLLTGDEVRRISEITGAGNPDDDVVLDQMMLRTPVRSTLLITASDIRYISLARLGRD
jgi:hypothetical protein